jgi:hypothetical protein
MNQYNFILNSFGLQTLKPRIYKNGEPLKVGHSDDNASTMVIANGLDDNMNGGVTVLGPLGTPVFCQLTIKSQDEKKHLPLYWVLAEVNMQKNIVKTTIQGRNGTVKEYISDGDYQVRLRGGLYSANNSRAYPKNEVMQLRDLLLIPDALKVTSEFLQLFNIYNIVVEDFSFPQQEGVQNIQLFDINCSEDKPIELRKDA